MPDIAEKQWTESDDKNVEQQPNGFPGGMPAYIDGVGRMLMGAIKRSWRRFNPYYLTTGTDDEYVVSPDQSPTKLNLYEVLNFRIDRANTTATPTLRFGRATPYTIVKIISGAKVGLDIGDLVEGKDHAFWFDGVNLVLSNPSGVGQFASTSTTVSAGDGLTGGGTLANDMTIALDAASIASLALADGSAQKAQNLADLADVEQARENLGIGAMISVAWFGASTSNTAAQNETAFNAAEAAADIIYVPAGTYQLSTPLNRGYTKRYYGPGVLRFDNAEWLRPGGSSGSVSVPERYTLFYEYENQSDVSVSFNGVAQTITWVDDFTVQAPGSLVTDAVRINIVNGKQRLPAVSAMLRSFNTIDGQAPNLAPSQPDAVTPPVGYDNWFVGTQTPIALTIGINNTIGGSRAGRSLETGNNNTAFGFQALYRASGDGNTAVGSIAGEWITTGEFNSLFGALAGAKIRTGNYNTALGYEAFAENETGEYNVAVGHRALANPREDIGGTPSETVAVGVFAGDFAFGDKNVWVGYRAGNGVVGGSDGTENVALGFFSMQNHAGADQNVAVGVSALNALTSGSQNVAVGHSALAAVTSIGGQVAVGYQALMASTSGTENTAVGAGALLTNTTASSSTAVGVSALGLSNSQQNVGVGVRAGAALTSGQFLTAVGYEAGRFIATADNGTFVGFRAGRATTAAENTAIGADALSLNTTGVQNTALGRQSLRLDQAGANQTTYNNTTGVGYDARVSGSNQVQIGNSATTTYVYGTVQNRSDERDKADIRDTELGLDFILKLRPVDYRWDMREDYIEVAEDGAVTRNEKDGSRKRTRFHHGFVAQEVAALGGVFGGLQDHSINGGNDVLSLGYDEFFAPVVKSIQQIVARLETLEKAA